MTTERVGCYVIETESDHPDKYFGSMYPKIASSWPGSRVTIAWWDVERGGE